MYETYCCLSLFQTGLEDLILVFNLPWGLVVLQGIESRHKTLWTLVCWLPMSIALDVSSGTELIWVYGRFNLFTLFLWIGTFRFDGLLTSKSIQTKDISPYLEIFFLFKNWNFLIFFRKNHFKSSSSSLPKRLSKFYNMFYGTQTNVLSHKRYYDFHRYNLSLRYIPETFRG